MYLVDTNVLSASAQSVAASSGTVSVPLLTEWMDRNSAHLYLSVITVAEVESGIAKSRRTGAFSKAKRLADWLETVLHLYGSRVLSLDLTVARGLGPLMDHAKGLGQTPGLADLAIAATARVHGLTVLTRNLRHFSFPGVPVHDPFDSLPS